MKIFRAIIEIEITGEAHRYATTLPVYYVAARDSRDAEQVAIRVACASASPGDMYRSRGTVIEISASDALGEPIGEPRTWDDINAHPSEVAS